MTTVDEYLARQTPDQQRVLHPLRALILTADDSIREQISWNIPFYRLRGQLFCYLNCLRPPLSGVDLAFPNANLLPFPASDLQSRNRKQVRSLVIQDLDEPTEERVRTLLQEMVLALIHNPVRN